MDAQEERMIALWDNSTQAPAGLEPGPEGSPDVEEGAPQLPMLVLQPEEMASKESRRRTLHELDDLLEVLEQASLADQEEAPDTVAVELSRRGLRAPHAYKVPQLIEIVFKTQAALMRANRSGQEPEPRGLDDRLAVPFLLIG